MEAILERERTTLRSLKRAAIVAWVATLLLPATGILLTEVPASGDEGMLAAVMMIGTIGGLALVLAILLTVGWLFRSRVTTMSAIEMRLADIEDLIERRAGMGDAD